MTARILLDDVSARLTALRYARQAFADRLAPDFNVFDFIERRELKLSQILGWLLDPFGSHAQGGAFLEEFARLFASHLLGYVGAAGSPELEAPCGERRRIDLLVDMGDGAIAIENKPYAGDQDGQLKHYLGFLSSYRAASLMYLTGTADQLPRESSLRREDRERSMNDGRLVLMSYGDLIPWLTVCRGRSESERVRVFLDDFRRFILTEFEGVSDMTEQEMLIEEIVRDPRRVEAAAKIASAWHDAQHTLLGRLHEQIAALAEPGWTITPGLSNRKDSFTDIGEADLEPAAFRIQFDGRNYGQFTFGIVRPNGTKADRTRLLVELDAALGDGYNADVTDEWAWWRYPSTADGILPVDTNWQNSGDPWQGIADGSLAPKIVAAARKLLEVVRSLN